MIGSSIKETNKTERRACKFYSKQQNMSEVCSKINLLNM